MFDLFSSMDFVSYSWVSYAFMIWGSSVVPLVVFFSFSNSFSKSVSSLKNLLSGLNGLLGSKVQGSLTISSLLLVGLFLLMLVLNVWGLFPGLFGVSCQITAMVWLSLQIWLSFQVSSSSKNFISYSGHLTPSGAPGGLVPFLNVVELISSWIRPVTLTLRLCMNMTTGHILLGLLNLNLSQSVVGGTFSALLLCTGMVGYYLFELVICGIQASVYTLLVSQYLDEHV